MASTSRASGAEKKSHASGKLSKKVGDPAIIGGVVASRAIFYERAAGKTRNPVGKKMFLSIMEEERRQMEAFSSIPCKPDIKARDVKGSITKFKSYFKKDQHALMRRIKETTNEVDALSIAMEMERKSIELYEKLSEKVKAPKEKALLDRMVKEEQQRYEIFFNTYLFLSDSGSWFMWGEHSITDGGTPWA